MYLRLVAARLSHLLRLVRDSGLPVYEREVGYKEIHRRLILMIGSSGGLTSHEIVTLTGHEKAQVSRAIKPLEQDGLIARTRLRAKLTLLPAGQAMYDKILGISRDRDRVLTAGILATDLKRFSAMTEALTVRAAQIYFEERRLSIEAGTLGGFPPSQSVQAWPTIGDASAAKPPPRGLLTPRLITLLAYLKRSAMLAYQRTHGVSYFQWQVLSMIGLDPPLPLARLITIMGRDKSQVGRSVAFLEQAGLIERSRPSRRRDILLEPTEKGMAFYDTLYDLALRRNDALWEGHGEDDRAFFAGVINKLIDNARDMAEKAGVGIN